MVGRCFYVSELVDDLYSEFISFFIVREKEVLVLVVDGKNIKEIVDELFIKIGMVCNYIFIILDKFEVKNCIEVIICFKEKGWFK